MNRSRLCQFHTQSRAVRWAVRAHPKPTGNLPLLIRSAEPETQPDAVAEQKEQDKADRGARTAENIRYGQSISEGGMGGKTTETDGSANQGGYGSTGVQDGQDSAEETRREQGYGPGSGVGA
ncbi:MAG: hypothetical protein Q9225_000547 [Loekoesia sp. 1 TL-2023]